MGNICMHILPKHSIIVGNFKFIRNDFNDVYTYVMVRYEHRPIIDREIDRKKTAVLIIP